MSRRTSSRFVRGYYAATVIAACVFSAAANEGHAATGPDFVASMPGAMSQDLATPFSKRFDCSQASPIVSVLASPAWLALPRPANPSAPFYMPGGEAVEGIASTYNPGDPSDRDAGDHQMASGERYDPQGWTAAVRTDLRWQFGGVRFGKNYHPTYALVEAGEKRIVVKINDVGPLRPGRIIDLNLRAMRYFDPTMQRGLIDKVKVTPLADTNVAVGPVEGTPTMNFAGQLADVRPEIWGEIAL